MIPPSRSLLQADGIEAGECIRSWTLGGLIPGNNFEYLAVELQQEEDFRLQGYVSRNSFKTRLSIRYPMDNGLDMDTNFSNWIGYGYVIF
jgi:hypothetical protein